MPCGLTIDENTSLHRTVYICNHRSVVNYRKTQRFYLAQAIGGHDLVQLQTYMGYMRGLIHEVIFKLHEIVFIP